SCTTHTCRKYDVAWNVVFYCTDDHCHHTAEETHSVGPFTTVDEAHIIDKCAHSTPHGSYPPAPQTFTTYTLTGCPKGTVDKQSAPCGVCSSPPSAIPKTLPEPYLDKRRSHSSSQHGHCAEWSDAPETEVSCLPLPPRRMGDDLRQIRGPAQ